ncbi:MAG: GAF domain-containing protein [Pseudomonadales bacterium]
MEKPQSPSDFDQLNKSDAYRMLADQLTRLLKNETNRTANAANTSALLFSAIPDVNWVGFYFLDDGELVLGPFQGQPACVRIPVGSGVCGTAAAEFATKRINNVHEFPGHIACDIASVSEIVVPLMLDGELIGVLDIDSPKKNRFDDEDQTEIENLARIFVESLGQDTGSPTVATPAKTCDAG